MMQSIKSPVLTNWSTSEMKHKNRVIFRLCAVQEIVKRQQKWRKKEEKK
jgi:hypothetical protein